jgi:hypothetical protein
VSAKYHWLPYTKGDPVLTFTKKQGFELGHRVTFFTFQSPSNSLDLAVPLIREASLHVPDLERGQVG